MLTVARPHWSLAVRALTIVGALVVDGPSAAIALALIQEGGLWCSEHIVRDASGQPFARALFVGALAVRLAVALPTHALARMGNGNGALFQDDYTNDLVGDWLLRIARGEGMAVFPGHQHLLDGVYPYLLMGLYAVFGYSPLVPKLLNAGCAALSAVLVFAIARGTFRGPSAVLAGLGAALLPTTIVWSIVALKETLVLTLSLLGLWIIQRLVHARVRDADTPTLVVIFVAIVAALTDLRATTAGMLVGLLVLVVLVRSRRKFQLWQIALTALVLLGMVGVGVWTMRARSSTRPMSTILEDSILVVRHRRAQEANNARSQFRPETEVLTPTGGEAPALEAASDATPFTIVGDVLEPLGFSLLAPAPWQASTPAERGAAAEMAIWYVLIAASVVAFCASPRSRLFYACLVAYGLGSWLVLAASEGNLGNLLRHRLMLEPVLLVLGCATLGHVWVRVGRPWSSRMPRLLLAPRAEA